MAEAAELCEVDESDESILEKWKMARKTFERSLFYEALNFLG